MSVRGSVRTVANGLVLFVLLLYLFVMVGFHAVAPGDTEQATEVLRHTAVPKRLETIVARPVPAPVADLGGFFNDCVVENGAIRHRLAHEQAVQDAPDPRGLPNFFEDSSPPASEYRSVAAAFLHIPKNGGGQGHAR